VQRQERHVESEERPRRRDAREDADPRPREDRDPRPHRAREDRTGLPAMEAAKVGLELVAAATGRDPEGIVSLEPTDAAWVVGVEVVEDRRIPSTADILAIYEATIDADGELISYARRRRYARGRTDNGGAA
jgi:Gas vesicle synthesis protein GvpO